MAAVLPGLDVLVSRLPTLLRGRSVGLLCHQASVTHRLDHAARVLQSMRGVKLRRLFAPEHGLTGAAQDHASIAAERDGLTGLPVLSLYGKRLEPHHAPSTASTRSWWISRTWARATTRSCGR